jgi:hypothetical protein
MQDFIDQSDPQLISKSLQINENNIEEELATTPSFYFTYACLAIEAEEIHDHATLALETYEQELAEKLKCDYIPTKKNDEPTQTELKRLYRADEKWNLLKKEQLKCYKNYKILEKGARAFELKAQMLMSMNKRDVFKIDKGIKD